jgi:hypothetical protein
MRRLISQAVVATALVMGVLFGSGGVVASAHPSVPLCGYVIAASRSIYDANGTYIARLRIWNYTCTNQAHAQVVATGAYCINVDHVAIFNNALGRSAYSGSGTLCNNGNSINSGVVPFTDGAMEAEAAVQGDYFYLNTRPPLTPARA